MRGVLVVAAVQLVAILGWAGANEWARATAPTFRIPLRPADPYDVLRGRYFILNPEDAALTAGQAPSLLSEAEVERFLRTTGQDRRHVGPALVGFCVAEELHRVCALRRLEDESTAVEALFWSRARVSIQRQDWTWQDGERRERQSWRVGVDLGLSRFFLPNSIQLPAPENEPGWELEVAHREGFTPLPVRLWFDGRQVLSDR